MDNDKIIITQSPEHIIKYFENFFSECFDKGEFINPNITHTKNGLQTSNIFPLISDKILNELKLNFFIPSFKELNKESLYQVDDIISNAIHLIDYNPKGYQSPHNHLHIEEFGWILYLNDNDGVTLFYTYPSPQVVIPKRGKLVFFRSHIFHEAKKCSINKKVVVGNIREINKKWIRKKLD